MDVSLSLIIFISLATHRTLPDTRNISTVPPHQEWKIIHFGRWQFMHRYVGWKIPSDFYMQINAAFATGGPEICEKISKLTWQGEKGANNLNWIESIPHDVMTSALCGGFWWLFCFFQKSLNIIITFNDNWKYSL